MATRIRLSSVAALVVLLAAGCGSAGSQHAATRRPSPKLSLTRADGRAGTADAAAPGALALRPTKYVLDGTLPDLGTQALVYRWSPHALDIAEVNRLADAFGINATATTTPDGYQVSDANATLTVAVTGGTAQVSYFPGGADSIGGSIGSGGGSIGSGGGSTDGSRGGASTGSAGSGKPVAIDEPVTTEPGTAVDLPPTLTPPVDVPSAHDAEAIARGLLDRVGVLAGQQWDSDVTDSGGIAVTCAVGVKCTGVPAQVTARDVTFTLVIGGVRVSGVGWTVTVGEHSRIDSVYGEWGSAAVLGTYDLRSTADAFAALQRGDANFGGVEPLAGDVPVKAQREPAPPADEPTVIEPAPPVDAPPVTPPVDEHPIVEPPDTVPIDVHITGVSLGIARWNAVDGNQNVVDLVPTYVFHTTVDGSSSAIEQLALDPAAIDFANPIGPPVPAPEPGGGAREPGPETVPPSNGSSSGSAPSGSAKTTPTS